MGLNELEIATGARVGKYGAVVYRDSDILPDGETYPLFNIVGGRVAITQIIGEVTVVIQTQSNNTKLTTTPTDGAAIDLCAALNITADAVGTLYGITGTAANVMLSGAIIPQATPIIAGVGTIDIDCAADSTGEIKWAVYYMPLDDGAYIEAAGVYVTTEGA